TALIYDQTCAAEKRRRRKRGAFPDPARRVFINEAVCEGCGDCGIQSNCMSILPVETEFGRKRQIDQSSCNKDYSCLKGFCPSFITIEGGQLRKGMALAADDTHLGTPPAPVLPATARPYGILVTGVGGTGVITIGALIGMAAHLDGKGVTVLDMTGLAQKGGSVYSHVRIADHPDALHAVRIAAGEADAVIGGDLIVSASVEALAKMAAGRTRAVINLAETPTSAFTRDPDWQFPEQRMRAAIREALGIGADEPAPLRADFIDAQALATTLLGDGIATNLFLLGFAWQRGLVPVSEAALMQAVELNGVAVEMNRKAFLWGRRAAHDLAAVTRHARPPADERPADLDAIVARRVEALTAYQDAAYAARYRALVERVRAAEAQRVGADSTALAEAVARSYHKLLAYKDEYEVARLYTDPAFWEKVEATFEGDYSVRFHLAAPLLARPDPNTGHIAKRAFGPGMMRVFRLLARLKGLRGTRWDIFGHTAERRAERALITEYEADIAELLEHLSRDRLPLALEIARLPEHIRGFGHVKAYTLRAAAQQRRALLARWRESPAAAAPAAKAASRAPATV
ncbi:MAG TPA: indolepyruvate ferredoxin oxidoreductase family protein, partial [Thauera sp.]|nr:indolepyruvate ferredoxin oxidoreductase family protein [Thauera sp.]